MKKRHFIISITGLSLITLLYFIINNENIVIILSLSQAIFSFITLMIAIVLFDRYQAGSKLNDKTINIVIEYIEFLRRSTIIAEIHKYEKKKLEKNGFTIVHFDSNNKIREEDNKKLFVDFISFMEFYNSFSKYIESPWMPKEIKLASKFLQLKEENTVYNLKYIKEDCLILTFSMVEKEDGLMTIENSNNLKEFNENVVNLMNVLNKWIKQQASDINFEI